MQKFFSQLYWPQKHIEQIAFLLALLIPILLIISQGMADISFVLVGLLFLVNSWKAKDWNWMNDRFLLGCLIVWIWLLFISFFAEKSVEDSLIRAIGWGRFILFPFALKYWIFEKVIAKKTAVLALGVVIAYVVIDTWVQYLFGFSIEGHGLNPQFRLSGPFGKMVVGTYIAKLGMIVVGGMLACVSESQMNNKYKTTIIVVVAMLLTILISNERMAFLSFGLAAIVFFLCIGSMRKIFMISSIPIAIILVIFVSASSNIQHHVFEKALNQIHSFKKTDYAMIYNNSWTMVKEHPFTGVGLKNYRLVCQEERFFLLPKLRKKSTNCGLHSHNVYLEWASETGLVGLTLFIFLMGFLIRESIYKISKLDTAQYYQALGALTALIPFLWPIMSSMSIFSNWNAVMFWYCIGWVYCHTREPIEANAS